MSVPVDDFPLNDSPEGGVPSLVTPIDLAASAETAPGVEVYERMARDLGGTQDRNAASHIAIAEHHEGIARHHRALAASVPDGDQAAADFGAVAVDHDLRNVAGKVEMSMDLINSGLDRLDTDHAAVAAFRSELARLEGRVALVEGLVRQIAAKLGVMA